MADNVWKLQGEAYGRVYDETLVFEKIERLPVPEEIQEQHLRHRFVDPSRAPADYSVMISEEERGVFRTETGVEVVVTPRYVGSTLGSNDDGRGNTICALLYAGEYTALAFYNEQSRIIEAVEY